MKTPIKTIRGLGEVHHGTHHHWMVRLTSLALVFLCIGFVFFVMAAAGSDYESAKDLVSNPFVTIFLLLLILVGCYHMHLGATSIPEDYFWKQFNRTASKIVNAFLSIIVCTTLVFAVLKISFGG